MAAYGIVVWDTLRDSYGNEVGQVREGFKHNGGYYRTHSEQYAKETAAILNIQAMHDDDERRFETFEYND